MNENELNALLRKVVSKLNVVSILHSELAESMAMLIKGYNDILVEKNYRISELERASETGKVTDTHGVSLPSDKKRQR